MEISLNNLKSRREQLVHFVCSAPGADSLPRHVIKNALKCLRSEHENNFPTLPQPTQPWLTPSLPPCLALLCSTIKIANSCSCCRQRVVPCRVLAKCIACLGPSREASEGRPKPAITTTTTATPKGNSRANANRGGVWYGKQSKCSDHKGIGSCRASSHVVN